MLLAKVSLTDSLQEGGVHVCWIGVVDRLAVPYFLLRSIRSEAV